VLEETARLSKNNMLHIFKKIFKSFLEFAAAALSSLRGMSFPSKYDWRMKFEMLLGSYEKETAVLCRKIIKPGMNIIDAGGHIGYYSVLFSKLTGPKGRIFVFEPEPVNLKLLLKNTERYTNIKIIPMAVSNQIGSVEFYRGDGYTACHGLSRASFRPEKIQVEATTLDSFAAKIGSPKIDLVKFDIEGAEPLALQGMGQLIKNNPSIMLIVEFCPENLYIAKAKPEEFLDQLKSKGFEIFLIRDNGRLETIKNNGEFLKNIPTIFGKRKENFVNLFCRK